MFNRQLIFEDILPQWPSYIIYTLSLLSVWKLEIAIDVLLTKTAYGYIKDPFE